MILKKEEILQTISEEVEQEDVEILEKDETHVSLWDNISDGYRYFYFDEHLTLKSLKERVYISSEADKLINPSNILSFIYNKIDRNALMVLNKIYFMCNEKDYEQLYQDTEDEYALYIMEDHLFGRNWTEQSIIIVDLTNIEKAVKETEKEDLEYGLESHYYVDLYREILLTIIHEFRHLVFGCNSYVSDEEYPWDLNTEEDVELYSKKIFRSLTKNYKILK